MTRAFLQILPVLGYARTWKKRLNFGNNSIRVKDTYLLGFVGRYDRFTIETGNGRAKAGRTAREKRQTRLLVCIGDVGRGPALTGRERSLPEGF